MLQWSTDRPINQSTVKSQNLPSFLDSINQSTVLCVTKSMNQSNDQSINQSVQSKHLIDGRESARDKSDATESRHRQFTTSQFTRAAVGREPSPRPLKNAPFALTLHVLCLSLLSLFLSRVPIVHESSIFQPFSFPPFASSSACV